MFYTKYTLKTPGLKQEKVFFTQQCG